MTKKQIPKHKQISKIKQIPNYKEISKSKASNSKLLCSQGISTLLIISVFYPNVSFCLFSFVIWFLSFDICYFRLGWF